ncbi:MAG: HIT domain-containing protein [archaeon]|nr:HIT domain-containing protein [archaeon]MCR4323876.1 HIT domain-containing protein [Nanoarchaeota archaeon]
MALSEEESKKIKEHLLNQLSNFPKEKQRQIKEQVNALTPPQVEEFIQENQLTHLGGKCIFCSIVAGHSPSVSIGEDTYNLAILEINPISKGHAFIVPKGHTKEINRSTHDLANKVAKEIQEKFSPKKIKIEEIKITGHSLLEVLPIYGDDGERKPATEEELKSLQEEILRKEETKAEIKEDAPLGEMRELYKIRERIPS